MVAGTLQRSLTPTAPPSSASQPVKHGIKVFCLCCAVTGYLIAFDVCTGDVYPRKAIWGIV